MGKGTKRTVPIVPVRERKGPSLSFPPGGFTGWIEHQGRSEKNMKVMVSACLLGENCKYNGGNNRNEELVRLLSGHTVIPVCPEVLGGMPTPRVPAEIRNGRVTAKDGRDVDKEFRLGAEKCLEELKQYLKG